MNIYSYLCIVKEEVVIAVTITTSQTGGGNSKLTKFWRKHIVTDEDLEHSF